MVLTVPPKAVKSLTCPEPTSTDEGWARVDSYPQSQPGLGSASVAYGPRQFMGGQRRRSSVIGPERRDEEGHDLVADHLVDDGVQWCEDTRSRPVKAVEQRGELRGGELLGKSGGAAYVREQDRDIYLRAAGRKEVVSVVAEARVLAGRLASGYLSDGTAAAGHGQQTAAAALRARGRKARLWRWPWTSTSRHRASTSGVC